MHLKECLSITIQTVEFGEAYGTKEYEVLKCKVTRLNLSTIDFQIPGITQEQINTAQFANKINEVDYTGGIPKIYISTCTKHNVYKNGVKHDQAVINLYTIPLVDKNDNFTKKKIKNLTYSFIPGMKLDLGTWFGSKLKQDKLDFFCKSNIPMIAGKY